MATKKKLTVDQRLDRLESLVSSVLDMANPDAVLIPAPRITVKVPDFELERLAAIDEAIRTRQHGVVMTRDGYPVRIVASDVCRPVKRGGGLGGENLLLGLMVGIGGLDREDVYESPDLWSRFGHRRDRRYDLVPYDETKVRK